MVRHFLELPREIRDLIYHATIGDPTRISSGSNIATERYINKSKLGEGPQEPTKNNTDHVIQLLATSHQVRNEVAEILPERVVFSDHRAHVQIPLFPARNLKKLSITIPAFIFDEQVIVIGQQPSISTLFSVLIEVALEQLGLLLYYPDGYKSILLDSETLFPTVPFKFLNELVQPLPHVKALSICDVSRQANRLELEPASLDGIIYTKFMGHTIRLWGQPLKCLIDLMDHIINESQEGLNRTEKTCRGEYHLGVIKVKESLAALGPTCHITSVAVGTEPWIPEEYMQPEEGTPERAMYRHHCKLRSPGPFRNWLFWQPVPNNGADTLLSFKRVSYL